jgi:hypothetical protein
MAWRDSDFGERRNPTMKCLRMLAIFGALVAAKGIASALA